MRTVGFLMLVIFSGCPDRDTVGEDAAAPPGDREEAMDGLRRLYEGARNYYADLATTPGVIPQVPTGATGFVPAQGVCCGNPYDQCVASPVLWSGHPWTDLMFSVDAPLYRFSYEWIAGTGPMPTGFTARASADLDCDGSFSLFEVYGVLGPDGSFPPFELAEMHIENEYE